MTTKRVMIQSKASEEMTLFDHFAELRFRLLVAVLAIVLCAIPCGVFWEPLFDALLLYPLSQTSSTPELIYTVPAEGFLLILKIALLCGFVIAMPVVLWQVWAFVSPALNRDEKVLFFPTFFVSILLFISGALFSYLMMPYVFSFLTEVAGDKMQPLFRAGEYLTFILKMVLAFGLSFELPVVSFVLAKLGLLSQKTLLTGMPYAVVGIFVLSAFLTPPDLVSQVVLALPLLLLYLISIAVVAMVGRRG